LTREKDCFSLFECQAALLLCLGNLKLLSNSSFSKNIPRRDNRFLWFSLLLLFSGIFIWILNSSYFNKASQEKISSYCQENSYQAYKNISECISNTYCSLLRLGGINTHAPKEVSTSETLPYIYPVIAPNNTLAWQQIMQSIAVLNKQIALAPNDTACRNRLGILFAQTGDFSSAAKQFNYVIGLCHQQIQAKDAQINKTLINKISAQKMPEITPIEKSAIYVQLCCARSNLARIYEKSGDHNRALRELQELDCDIAFAGDIPELAQVKALSYSQIARSNNKLTPAEATVFARAEALREVGRLPEAQQEYIKLIKANPKLAIAHQRLGLLGVAENNLWLAINELQTAAQLDTKDPDTENDLGLILEQIGDYKSAQQAFSNAHKIDPKHLSASINLANLLANAGDCKSGIAIMRQATIDHPLSPTAYNNLAALIARTNNQSEAAKTFAKAISLDPALPSAHYGLGLALLKLKSYPEAITEFQTAMTLNPGILDLQNKIDLAYRCNLRSLASTQIRVH